MATLRNHPNYLPFLHCFCSRSPKIHQIQYPSFTPRTKALFFTVVSESIRVLKSSYSIRGGNSSFRCFCNLNSVNEQDLVEEVRERPLFDINLAVILAGFAFEAYSSPPENVGRREVDAVDCQTVFLSESFLREVYDGQLFIKLKKGVDFPAMDPWGTSDPYVVMQLDGQVVKSKVKWATKDPTWNEEFTLNIKKPSTKNLQVAAWDANLVTPHKRMGNASISLESICDGNLHEVLMELEGMGGGGTIHLEVKYKSFDEIDEEKQWWRIPFVSDFLRKNSFESALKIVVGSETVQARQFVQYAFGQLKSFNDSYIQTGWLSKSGSYETESFGKSKNSVAVSDKPSEQESSSEDSLDDTSCTEERNILEDHTSNGDKGSRGSSSLETQAEEATQSDKYYWKNFADIMNRTVVQKLGFPVPEKIKWDRFDLLNKIGIQSRQIAEAGYIESGLATPKSQDVNDATTGPLNINMIQSSLPDIKKASWDVLRQTDSVLGALMVLTTAFSQQNKGERLVGKDETEKDASTTVEDSFSGYLTDEKAGISLDGSVLDETKAEEMKALFSTAESAMEAWAMLATSLGHPSFIKSEFEKICFLDNTSTDTQVAIWRDSAGKRLVVAFRGTEQTKWKDLITDLMLVPAGLNPERLGGDFKQEAQVHSGFLSAYDSVRTRILSLVKLSIGSTIWSLYRQQLLQMVAISMRSLGSCAMFYLAAAVSDFYVPWKSMAEHKIQSASGPLDMRLVQVPKTLSVLREEWAPIAFCISFKLETDPEILLEKADMALRKYKMHVVVANELLTRKEEVIIVTSGTRISVHREDCDDVENPLIKLLIERHSAYIQDSCTGI